MASDGDNSGRVQRFFVMYAEWIEGPLDQAEFEVDDLYAFLALERAMRSENQELRNLAVHLQTQRQERLEAITVEAAERLERLDRTQKLKILPLERQTAEPAASVMEAQAETATDASPTAAHMPASEAAPTPPPVQHEQRAGARRLDPEELARALSLQELYGKQFGLPLDIGRFFLDDDCGRSILDQSREASSLALAELAEGYFGEDGRPRMHRRGAPRTASL